MFQVSRRCKEKGQPFTGDTWITSLDLFGKEGGGELRGSHNGYPLVFRQVLPRHC